MKDKRICGYAEVEGRNYVCSSGCKCEVGAKYYRGICEAPEKEKRKRTIKRKSIKTKNRLTVNFKHGVAENIIAAIKDGNNTFGKLRKALHYTDRELKSGLRYGLNNWIYKSKISKDKKTYSVVAL